MLEVTDGVASATDDVRITVEDTLVPVIGAVTDIIGKCAGPAGTVVVYATPAAWDICESVSGGVARAAFGNGVCMRGYDCLVHGGGFELECIEYVVCGDRNGFCAAGDCVERRCVD